MRTSLLTTLALTWTLLLCADAGAQLPRYVNCGDENGFPGSVPGWELLGESVFPPGIGLAPAPLDTVHVGGNFPSFWGTMPQEPDVLARDPDQDWQTWRDTALWLADDTVLGVAGLTPGASYRVRLLLGAASPWGELTDLFDPPHWTYLPSLSRDLRVEHPDGAGWRTLASGVRCVSADQGSTYATFLGGQVALWVLAQADAGGTLRLRLSTDGSDPVFLSAFELHEHEPLPIVYWHGGGEFLVAMTSSVVPFVSAFNTGDMDAARVAADALADPFERGVALMHIAGWLDGSQHGLGRVASDARAALTGTGASHPATAWLLDQLTSFDRARAHLAASGFESAWACPEDGGTGFLNTDCGEVSSFVSSLTRTNANAHIAVRELAGMTAAVDGASVLDQLAAWNAGNVDTDHWEPSPLVFAAAKLSGTTMVTMNPSTKTHTSDADALAFAARRDALVYGLVDLGFAASHFPTDLELLLFREWLEQGALPHQWPLTSFEDLFTPAQLEASWWGERVALTPHDPSAPAWANLQRQQLALMSEVARYWLEERRQDGALGGGLGDDVELLAQLGKVYAGLQDQSHRRALDGLDDIARWVLNGSGEVQGGYFAGGMTDVEHAAEYTTNAYLSALAAYGHTATAAEVGLGVAERLLYDPDPALAFAGNNAIGRTHFKSFVFTANGHGGDPAHAWDTLLNGRAMYPAVTTALRAPLSDTHPMVADLLRWADAWRDDALDPSGSKPQGWYGPVAWPTNAFGNSFWWNTGTSAGDVSELAGGVHSYTLDLMRMAYHRSEAPDRWRYLLPAVRIFRSVMDWEDAGLPANPPQGSAQWAASLIKPSNRFGGLVLAHLGALAADPDLTSLADPLNPGTTYVDAALLARMEGWVEVEFNGQPAALLYALGDLSACTAGHTAKAISIFTGNYAKVISYYQQLYPLLTSQVIHTDRVKLSFSGGGPNNLLAAANGENVEEGIVFQPLVRWRKRSGHDADFAVQCNARGYDGSLYGAFTYNFGTAPMDVELQLDHGLAPGEYLVEWGPSDGKCDLFSGVPTQTLQVQKRGVGVAVELRLDPGQSLVRVLRLSDADQLPAGYDLALDPPTARLVPGAGGQKLELEARVVNLGAAPSPPAILRLYASAMAPDGSLPNGSGEVLLGMWSVPALAGSGAGFQLDGFAGTWKGGALVTPQRVTGPHGPGPSGGVGVLSGFGPASPTTGIGPSPLGETPSLPFTQVLAGLVQNGLGLQLRAEVEADGLESDLLNNGFTRGWLVEDMAPDLR